MHPGVWCWVSVVAAGSTLCVCARPQNAGIKIWSRSDKTNVVWKLATVVYLEKKGTFRLQQGSFHLVAGFVWIRSTLISQWLQLNFTLTHNFLQSRGRFSKTKQKWEYFVFQQKHIFDGTKVRQSSPLNSGEIQPSYAQSQTLKTPNNSKVCVCSYIFQTDQFS